jgi:SAM-dependent methyltransferase
MRAPGKGIKGYLALKFMEKMNVECERIGINRMELTPEDVFMEIGAGHGYGLRAIGNGPIPKRIIWIDISPVFLDKLKQTKLELEYGEKVEIYGADCKEMKFLQDESVDKIFALNVVYFLSPLPVYLQELHRVLKPNGTLVFGGYFGYVPDSGAFINTKAEPIESAMEEAGFDVTTTKVFGQDSQKPLYIEIKGIKS